MGVRPGGRGAEVSAVYSFFLALSTITILLRVYCRARVVQSLGFDDWFAVIAWVGHRFLLIDIPSSQELISLSMTDIFRFLLCIRYHRCTAWDWPTYRQYTTPN